MSVATLERRPADQAVVDAKQTADPTSIRQAKWALFSLNFFSADQTGIGPFFSVFLARHGWSAGLIGTVMTIGGLAGLAATAPAGLLADHTRRKRTYVILSGVFTIAASSLIWFSQSFWVVAASQLAGALAASIIGPAMLGLTLGVVRQRGFNRQNGRNQAFNHAGNLAFASLSGWVAWKYGFGPVFLMGCGLGLLSIVSVLAIPRKAVDHRAARGLTGERQDDRAQAFTDLLRSPPLLVVTAALTLFNICNGAMLPLYGLAVIQAHRADPALFAAATIVVAQAVMVVTALIASRMVARQGYWLVILISFIALPIRAVFAASLITAWGVIPVQVLDGVGAGLLGVGVSGLMTRLLDGTGRVNGGQGAMSLVQGLGGSLSPLFGGWLAQLFGYSTAFLLMGATALGSLVIWIAFGQVVRRACAEPSGEAMEQGTHC
jgi:MFS family permease